MFCLTKIMVLVIFGLISITSLRLVSQAQLKPLTYPELITALNTRLPNSVFKNKTQLLNFLISQIRQRKVDKALTTEREELLREAGATEELIGVIRQNIAVAATASRSPAAKTPVNPPKLVSGGVVNGKAIELIKPIYPAAAIAAGASGAVNVQVTIDENGDVIDAKAVSGHVLLQEVAVTAARATKFTPTLLSGARVKVTGMIVYNFIAPARPAASYANTLGMEFVLIPAGSFMMGAAPSETDREDDEIQRQVTISRSFYLGKFEVTQEQWEKVMGNNPSYFKNCPKCPVESVSWDEAQNFILKLNARGEGKYRLPTEAEWEYAARARTATKFGFGENENLLGEYGWFAGNSQNKTQPVGSKLPNPWGLYDMHGNVWEWVGDWKGDYRPEAATDPTGPPSGVDKIGRGGGWNFSPQYLRSANRSYYSPKFRYNYLGLRLVREL